MKARGGVGSRVRWHELTGRPARQRGRWRCSLPETWLQLKVTLWLRAPGSKRAKFIASAQRWGVILAVLLVLDLMTGDGFWVQWPALGIALWLAFRSRPLFEHSE